MSHTLDPTNLSALQFNLESIKTMNEICEPILNKNLGLTAFTYCRTFHDGTRLYISSDADWVKYYLSSDLHNDVEHLECYAPSDNIEYALWTGFKQDKVFSTLLNQFHWWHGFSIYERHERYIDYFDFTAHKDCTQIVGYYLNNIDNLKDFLSYFKEKASTLINPNDKRKLMVSKKWKPFSRTSKNSLLDPYKAENFIKQISINPATSI